MAAATALGAGSDKGDEGEQEDEPGEDNCGNHETDHGALIVGANSDVVAAVHAVTAVTAAISYKPSTSGEIIHIDEVAATAKCWNIATGNTTFVFDPPYARVIFAAGINRHNPDLKLPEHEPAGFWEVSYDVGSTLNARAWFCSDFGCYGPSDCLQQTNGNCDLCHEYRVDNECDHGLHNAIGICSHGICRKAVDTPKLPGESDAVYYQRMDKLHWQ
ncbi:hypothetical protein NLG97_g3693 [Lecanicillium saksenae]|uniref:Uncharacterized protein n=1 Tax=Lecanicillium saksenae TaxID=468837 RepID=A0ACC1QYL2_9HYPO|nr:hypothetical protein NLG97_g3693 [Lecanicillium saksenae]